MDRFADAAKKADNIGDLAKRFEDIGDATGIGRKMADMMQSMKVAQTAMEAFDAVGDVAKRAEAAKAVGRVMELADDVPTRTVFKNVMGANDTVLDTMVEIAQASPASFRKVSDLVGDSGDLAKKFNASLEKLDASKRLDMAGVTKSNPEPSGLKRAAKYCGKNPGRCIKKALKTVAVTYGLVKLSQLDDNEAACIDACLPTSKEGETPVVPNVLSEEQKKDGLFVCDGTEATGETYADCKKYCETNCTSLDSKCNWLGIKLACNVLSGATNVATNVVKEGIDSIFNALGLGNLGDILKYMIVAVVGIVFLVVLYYILRFLISVFSARKNKSVAPEAVVRSDDQQQPAAPPSAAAVPAGAQ